MRWIDPNHLPATEGGVKRVLVNAHDEPDGVPLTDGLEMRIPLVAGVRFAPADADD